MRLHPAKANLPILTTESGMFKDLKLVQCSNDTSAISVTDDGMVTDSKFSQSQKAETQIFLIPSGIS